MRIRLLPCLFILFVCLLQPAAGQEKLPVTLGTGFIVAPGGYVLTTHHTIQDKQQILVGSSAKKMVIAQIIKVDAKNDLVLLKARLDGAPLPITPWSEVPLGLEAFVIGFPQPSLQGVSRKITQGIINGDRTESGDAGYFQFSAEIQKGNSGGPVLAPDGSVIGMVRAKLNALSIAQRTQDLPQNVNYAIKSAMLLQFLDGSPAAFRRNSLNLQVAPRAHQIYRQASDSVVLVIGRNNK